jgi:uncharacterized protein YndB with AHSA1/START domain
MPTALKWILGILGAAVVFVCFAAWYGYRKLQSFAGEGPSSVTIGAPASRVFASMADADSMKEWRSEGLGIRASRQGRLAVGDTLVVQNSSTTTTSSRRSRSTWVVTAVIPDVLLALEVRNDSSGEAMFMRRDSLIALGDSTRVMSTFSSPVFDKLKRRGDTSGKARSAMLNLASNVMIAGLRMVSDQELKRLRGHIEGHLPN